MFNCMLCALPIFLSCRAISMVGRALTSSQLEVDATDLPECLHQPGPDFSFPKRSFGKKTVVQGHCNTVSEKINYCYLVFKMAFSPLQ